VPLLHAGDSTMAVLLIKCDRINAVSPLCPGDSAHRTNGEDSDGLLNFLSGQGCGQNPSNGKSTPRNFGSRQRQPPCRPVFRPSKPRPPGGQTRPDPASERMGPERQSRQAS